MITLKSVRTTSHSIHSFRAVAVSEQYGQTLFTRRFLAFQLPLLLKLLVLWMGITSALTAFSQGFSAQVSSKKVQVGTPFELMFTISVQAANFTPPNLSDFDVVSGPNQSSSIQVVNGAVSQQLIISYGLVPKKEGKLNIGPATIVSGNQKIASNPISIEAVKGNVNTSSNSEEENKAAYKSKIGGDEVFFRTFVSKTKCYQGEQITITQKIYSRYDVVGIKDAKIPSYSGFWTQQQDKNAQIQAKQENLEGVTYVSFEYSKTFAFPTKSGELTVESTDLELVVRKASSRKPRNIFEQFFGNGGYEDVIAKVKSKPVKITVMELPELGKPANFNGAVGNFSYKVESNKQSLKANEALNLKIALNGKGNLKLIDAPRLNLPESFEVYDPKINENISTAGGVSGSKSFDYLIIPREEGSFQLDDLTFSYFNPETAQYVTLPASQINIQVLPGDPNAVATISTPSKTEVKETENDIRYIKKGNFELNKQDHEFFNSFLHLVLLLLSPLGLAAILWVRRKHLIANSNMALVNERKAGKLARHQLSQAEKQMKAGQKDIFYTEILTALTHYLSRKLTIPISDLSKETIKAQLLTKNVEVALQQTIFSTLDTCEYAKYAPGAVSGNLNKVYQDTVELITRLEAQLQRKA